MNKHLTFSIAAVAVWAMTVAAIAAGQNPAPADAHLLAAVKAISQPSGEIAPPPRAVPSVGGPDESAPPPETPETPAVSEKRVLSVPDHMDRIMTLHEKASRMKGDQTFEAWANDITKRSTETATKLGSLIPLRKTPAGKDVPPPVADGATASSHGAKSSNTPPKVTAPGPQPAPSASASGQQSKSADEPRSPISAAGQPAEAAVGQCPAPPEKAAVTQTVSDAPPPEAKSAVPADASVNSPPATSPPQAGPDNNKTVSSGAVTSAYEGPVPAASTASPPSSTTEAHRPVNETVLPELERLAREQIRLLELAKGQSAN